MRENNDHEFDNLIIQFGGRMNSPLKNLLDKINEEVNLLDQKMYDRRE